jgi:hypothetical protein
VSSQARFSRQEILAEVGPAGQARLGSATLYLGDDVPALAATMARTYAERAGISRVVTSNEHTASQAEDAGPWLACLRHVAPHSVATGATLALQAMRGALDLEVPSKTLCKR